MDADCIIAGTLASAGAASEILDLWREGEFELVACPHLVYEVTKTLLHPRIYRRYDISRDQIESLGALLSGEAVMMDDPVDPPRVVANDPGDDYLIALALTTDAVLVTRDRHFEGVHSEGVRIHSPRDLLREFGLDA